MNSGNLYCQHSLNFRRDNFFDFEWEGRKRERERESAKHRKKFSKYTSAQAELHVRWIRGVIGTEMLNHDSDLPSTFDASTVLGMPEGELAASLCAIMYVARGSPRGEGGFPASAAN